MCELFGYSGTGPIELNEILGEFFSHSDQHPDGWGITFGDVLEKEPTKASESPLLESLMARPIVTDFCFAHIRYATTGNLSRINCHPFKATDSSGREWTLNHNGTILASPELDEYRSVQEGETDSERILLYLIDEMNRALAAADGELDAKRRFEVVDKLVCRLSANNNKLNLLLFDGELLYGHTNFGKTLHVACAKEGVFFSTQPLVKGAWTPAPLNTLTAYRHGAYAFTGTNHGNECHQSHEQMEALHLASLDS